MTRRKRWDVMVIGAGPAGATAAYHLAKEGYEVLMIDRAKFPRPKPCGGALSNKVYKYLVVETKSLKAYEIYGAEFSFNGQERFRINVSTPIAKLVHREELDARIVAAAVEVGTEFIQGKKVSGIREEEEFIEVSTDEGEVFQARCLIGADGPRGVSTRYLNPRDLEPMGIAMEEEIPLENIERTDLVNLDFGRFPYGYGWIFPKEGLSSVGCGAIVRKERISLKASFQRFRESFGFLPQKRGKVRVHLLPYYKDLPYKRAGNRLLLTGDAARLMDPFLGEGIYYALASGTLAAQAIIASFRKNGKPGKIYTLLLEREILPDLKHAVWMANFVYPRIYLGFKTLKRSSRLGLLYIKVMSGELSYRDFNKKLFQAMKEAGKKKLAKVFTRRS